jgi:hypothetical protein
MSSRSPPPTRTTRLLSLKGRGTRIAQPLHEHACPLRAFESSREKSGSREAREAAKRPGPILNPMPSLACNHHLEAGEYQYMVTRMPRHLVFYLVLVLTALLPLETAHALHGCAPVTAMDDHEGDCGCCITGEHQQCRAYCIALCQSFLTSPIQEFEVRAKASSDRHPHEAACLKAASGGPEPPPPRLAQ